MIFIYCGGSFPLVGVPFRSAGEHPSPRCHVSGLVWNCTDILPGFARDRINGLIDSGRCGTYAAAARALKPMIAKALAGN
jgi:hypothetical protein